MNRFEPVLTGYLRSCHNRQPVAVAVRRNLAEKPDRTGLPDTTNPCHSLVIDIHHVRISCWFKIEPLRCLSSWPSHVVHCILIVGFLVIGISQLLVFKGPVFRLNLDGPQLQPVACYGRTPKNLSKPLFLEFRCNL